MPHTQFSSKKSFLDNRQFVCKKIVFFFTLHVNMIMVLRIQRRLKIKIGNKIIVYSASSVFFFSFFLFFYRKQKILLCNTKFIFQWYYPFSVHVPTTKYQFKEWNKIQRKKYWKISWCSFSCFAPTTSFQYTQLI